MVSLQHFAKTAQIQLLLCTALTFHLSPVLSKEARNQLCRGSGHQAAVYAHARATDVELYMTCCRHGLCGCKMPHVPCTCACTACRAKCDHLHAVLLLLQLVQIYSGSHKLLVVDGAVAVDICCGYQLTQLVIIQLVAHSVHGDLHAPGEASRTHWHHYPCLPFAACGLQLASRSSSSRQQYMGNITVMSVT